MQKLKRMTLTAVMVILLLSLTACGLKLNKETLSEDGGIYKVGSTIWQFNKNGTVNMYKANGQPVDDSIKYIYNVKDDGENYILTLDQNFANQGEDYKVKFTTEMKIKIAKKGQKLDKFKGEVVSVTAKDSEIDSNMPELKELLQKQYGQDNLNNNAEFKKAVGKSYTFEKEPKSYLTKKPNYKSNINSSK